MTGEELGEKLLQSVCEMKTGRATQAIQDGINAADKGRLINHNTLVNKWEQKRAAAVD